MASLTILEEMCQLEVDKEDLRKQLIETQREMLAWEKKEELAAETKHNMESAKKEGGEIGVMKTEIHRMEVGLYIQSYSYYFMFLLKSL